METMNAAVYNKYGAPEVLHFEEVKKPVPKNSELLVKVSYVAVNYGDLVARDFKHLSFKEFNMPFLFFIIAKFSFGLSKPKRQILGNIFSGVVEQVGKDVKRFVKGEPVFGYMGESMGAYAEYLTIPENGIIASKPSNMTFTEAAVVPYGTIMALNLLKKLKLQKGRKVLIIGASGGIGAAALQLAKNYYGAEVTGVCGTQSIDYVKKLGADLVVDYKKEKVSGTDKTYDVILDVLGKGSFKQYKKILNENGIYFLASFKGGKLMQMLWTSILGGKKVKCAIAMPNQNDLLLIKELVEAGKIISVIDKTFPLEKASEAHKYIESGQKKANVVLTL